MSKQEAELMLYLNYISDHVNGPVDHLCARSSTPTNDPDAMDDSGEPGDQPAQNASSPSTRISAARMSRNGGYIAPSDPRIEIVLSFQTPADLSNSA